MVSFARPDDKFSVDIGKLTCGQQDMHVLALDKGGEQYVFLFTEQYKAEILRVMGRFACSPELSFTWYEAAVLSQKVRQDSPRPCPQAKLEEDWYTKESAKDTTRMSKRPEKPSSVSLPWNSFVIETPTIRF